MLLFLFMSMGWEYVSELRPRAGLLFPPPPPPMIYEYAELRWNDIDRENGRTRTEICSSVIVSTNLKWMDQDANPGSRCERPTTNHLSHGMDLTQYVIKYSIAWAINSLTT
jgi:hypothetical protein